MKIPHARMTTLTSPVLDSITDPPPTGKTRVIAKRGERAQ